MMLLPADDKKDLKDEAAFTSDIPTDPRPQSPYGAPPPYFPSTASEGPSTDGPSAWVPGPAARVNHVYLSEQNSTIKGTWTLDPNVRIPPPFLPKLAPGQPLRTFNATSHNGSVNVYLNLSSDTPTKSDLFTSSHNGTVTVHIGKYLLLGLF